jgi:tRNA-2-methylthio-N6-dimethylallyladenosine synthase
MERNGAAVVDGHVARHSDDVAEAVGLGHGFVEQGSDDAPMRMPGRPLELRFEADTAEDTLFFINEEFQMETRRIVVATTEAAVQRPVRQRKFVTHAALYSHPDMAVEKTFFLETFGCQMNVHDSEKVIGTLQQQGYSQVDTEEAADLILYNTCSIRDKAEQKVFHRLADFKKLKAKGKQFGVLGCVAQQEGEKIFERAPYVSLVAGSASYRNLPQMLLQIESGQTRVTGLDDRQTDQTFETEFTARTNPHRGYITIIEGCDKFCAYCVVPYTRGKERSRTSTSVLEEARRMADAGYTDIQLLGQNVNSYRDPAGKRSFAELLAAVGELSGIRRVRFTTSHPRDFTKDIIDAIDAVPTLCDHVHLPVQSGSSRVLQSMFREYTREQYLERIGWMKAARNREISITTDVIVGFPGETEDEFRESLGLLTQVGYDGVFSFKYSPRPNTPALQYADSIPEDEKSRRLQILQEHQREIQRVSYRRHLGSVLEVMVEGKNAARGQVNGRTSQNKTLNFTCGDNPEPNIGDYVKVQVTQAFPNSLLGELAD